MKTIYKVEMMTDNPSANGTGFFSTMNKAEEVICKYKLLSDFKKDYYGKVVFSILEVSIDNDVLE